MQRTGRGICREEIGVEEVEVDLSLRCKMIDEARKRISKREGAPYVEEEMARNVRGMLLRR